MTSQREAVHRTSTSLGDAEPEPSTSKRVIPSSSLPPYGTSLFPIIWRLDPQSDVVKSTMLVVTAAGLCVLFFLPILLIACGGLDGRWDDEHGIRSISGLMESTLGISSRHVLGALQTTFVVFGGLVVADLVLGKRNEKNIWPTSWNTDNTVCYLEMFSEPTRFGRLLRRPGNTLSNASYLFGSICILVSTTSSTSGKTANVFVVGDFLFGVMMLILAVASTIWHGSNAPASQYPDLWSMDCCIVYLIIRYACFGGMCVVMNHSVLSADLSKMLAGWTCAIGFVYVIYKVGRWQHGFYQKKWLHGSCPFSVRARLTGKSDLFGRGHFDVRVRTVCAYAGLPVYYTAIPTTIQFLLVGSMGSVMAANLAFRTLLVGWSYRMVDRWTVDGCVPLNWIVQCKPTSLSPVTMALQTIGAAFFSPTAVLHAMTGITLLAGYMHARSVDGLV